MRPAFVRGLGLWTPGFAGPEAWCRSEPDDSVAAPAAALLAGPLRRRASGITRVAVEALQGAIAASGCDPAATPSIWATAHGEHETAIAMLEMMHNGEGKLSPTRFHNSVHNTPSGYASIATGNRAPSTTVTGGRELVGAAFLEAFCLLEAGAEDVALVLSDEPLRRPFGAPGAHPLGLAFCLSGRSEGALGVLANLRRDAIAPVKAHERFGALYVSAALPLLEHVVLRRPGTVALELEAASDEPVACIDLELAAVREASRADGR